MNDFSNIIGHEDIIEYFQNTIRMDKVSHACLLNGPDKSGKMLLAEAYAAALQCEAHGEAPCGTCRSCRQAAGRNQPDIIYVTHEKPNTISVDDIRRQINGDVILKPYGSRYKVYIVDEAEKMNVQAQNALLKTLEEPPEYAVILLLTANANALLTTLLSRCVRLDLKAVSDDKIRKFLMEAAQVPDYQADVCTAFAQGNVGKALALAGSEHFHEIKESVLQALRRIHDMELFELMQEVRQIASYKLEIQDYFDLMMIWYRDVLLYKATADVNKLVFREEVYTIQKAASHSSYSGIEAVLKALEKAKARVLANVNFELLMELLLFTIKEN